MTNKLKLMCILAHPDDESLGNGGILAKYAAEGVETYLVTATRGERGWFGDESEYPGLESLGKIREAELLAAASVLGIRRVDFLDYIDGDLDQAYPAEVIAKIVGHIRRVKPDVVVTFGPDGGYGHPDHIAICQFTTAAIVESANATSVYQSCLAPHAVSKLYYIAPTFQLGVAGQQYSVKTWPYLTSSDRDMGYGKRSLERRVTAVSLGPCSKSACFYTFSSILLSTARAKFRCFPRRNNGTFHAH